MRSRVKQSLGLPWRARAQALRVAALAAHLACLPLCNNAGAEVVISRYVVSLDGTCVGEATLHTDLAASRYKVGVSADVSILLISTQIKGEASGARSGAKLTPEQFQIAMSGGSEDVIEFRFANSPEAAADGAVRLRGVFDPLSALLVASLKPSSPSSPLCNNVLPIFTGRDLLDLKLRPKPSERGAAEPALALCQATLSQPLAGEEGPAKLALEISFMKSAKPHLWLVEHIAVPTTQGLLAIDRTDTSMKEN